MPMPFHDRRPGAGQLDIYGQSYQPERPDPARGYAQLGGKKYPRGPYETSASGYNGGGVRAERPVGMRGSLAERRGVPARIAAQRGAHDRIESFQSRMQDEGGGDDGDYMEEPDIHPTSGFPTYGAISTHDDIGMPSRQVPDWASFHGSAVSARRRHGTVTEVPIQDANGPSIGTPQWSVSASRMHEQMDNPETRSNPRLGYTEHPDVYHDPWLGEHTVIDGNHRIAGALMRNEMFQPANVLTEANRKGVAADTKRVNRAKVSAAYSAEERGRTDFVNQRMNDIWMGEQW